MAHEISKTNGQASMAYIRSEGTPWHGLGTAVEEAMTAKEAFEVGGLAFDVESLPIFARRPDGSYLALDDIVLNVRSDTGEVLGRVSSEYKVVQNWTSFEFMDGLVAEGGMRYHTVGALGKGERIWLLGKCPGHIRVAGTDDLTEQYLLLYNSHNGSSALRVFFTPTRVVCANTLAVAMGAAGTKGVSIRHTGDITAKIEDARQVLGMASDFFRSYGEGVNAMANYKPTVAQVTQYFETLYPPLQPGKFTTLRGHTPTTVLSLLGLFEHGVGNDMPGVRGTAYAAFNAVTEFIDHYAGNKVGKESRKRFEESLIQGGAQIKKRAYDLALEMVAKPHAEFAPAPAPEPETTAVSVAVAEPKKKARKAEPVLN